MVVGFLASCRLPCAGLPDVIDAVIDRCVGVRVLFAIAIGRPPESM